MRSAGCFHFRPVSRIFVAAFTTALLFGGVAPYAVAATPVTIKLWEKGAPGTPATKPQDEPILLMTPPVSSAVAVPTAVIILPGGGYGGLAMDHEGSQIADWYNNMGVTAFILKYRMHGTGHMHPVPMMDGQRAIRTVRARAKEWNIDPTRIGVMGFSAGGHLASTLGTHFDAGDTKNDDPIERVGCRPDFLILCYPVISTTADYAHKGSVRNLLGPNPAPKLLENLSNDKQVTPETPPTFIFQTSEDTGVPAENCIAFYLALHKAGAPAEMHIFESGPHGVGLAKDRGATSKWPELCQAWLKAHGWLKPAGE